MTLPSSSSSRNDLFSTSLSSIPPPKPPPPLALPIPTTRTASPRTSSFFDGPPNPTPPRHPQSYRPSPLDLSTSTSSSASSSRQTQKEPLSPLHQSPSLPSFTASTSTWQPPIPPRSDDITLRFIPSSTYLLGQGRYATVYLASYKQHTHFQPNSHPNDNTNTPSWQLCAAKQMSQDRESQTMGLREAFFLNRLSPTRTRDTGSLYIIKLIAVKEDEEPRRKSPSHSRSASDALTRPLVRQRSSTIVGDEPSLSSFPSLPVLRGGGGGGGGEGGGGMGGMGNVHAPSFSRLVLLLEHAPLGTLDRLLRSSPGLVGREIWSRWARECTEALAWVHSKGVVHADIKPGNLLLTDDLHLRLSDFGSSLLVHPDHPPVDGLGLGTLPFSPPELVDPTQSFSFPVDVFALGATLYQCITGKEPYRGARTVEMMHHVRRGELWIYEERSRISRIGEITPNHTSTGTGSGSISGSPYPSAWRGDVQDGLRRGGSLRVAPKPRLNRMSSAESLKASEDAMDGSSSPAGVKLWAKWSHHRGDHDAVSILLEDDHGDGDKERESGSLGRSGSGRSGTPSTRLSLSLGEEGGVISVPGEFPAYEDGTPAMVYLDGGERVDVEVREVIRRMVHPLASERPTAEDVLAAWNVIGV